MFLRLENHFGQTKKLTKKSGRSSRVLACGGRKPVERPLFDDFDEVTLPIDTKPGVVAFETEAVLTQTFIQRFPYIKTVILEEFTRLRTRCPSWRTSNSEMVHMVLIHKFSSHSLGTLALCSCPIVNLERTQVSLDTTSC